MKESIEVDVYRPLIAGIKKDRERQETTKKTKILIVKIKEKCCRTKFSTERYQMKLPFKLRLFLLALNFSISFCGLKH